MHTGGTASSLSFCLQVGAVTHLHVCEAWPHHCAVSSSTRVCAMASLCSSLCMHWPCTELPGAQVLIYDGSTCQSRAQLTRFKDKAYGARFRADGKLIVAGGETGIVQVHCLLSHAGPLLARHSVPGVKYLAAETQVLGPHAECCVGV